MESDPAPYYQKALWALANIKSSAVFCQIGRLRPQDLGRPPLKTGFAFLSNLQQSHVRGIKQAPIGKTAFFIYVVANVQIQLMYTLAS